MTTENALTKLEFDRVRQRLLRYAASDPGAELIRALSIVTSTEEIRRELEEVSELKRLLEQEEFALEGVHPVQSPVQKAGVEGTVLTPRELLQIGGTLRAARNVRSFASRRREQYPLLWQTVEPLYIDKVLEFNIEQAIDETGNMREKASRELQMIRRGIAERYEQLKKRLEGILHGVSEQGFTQEDIITTREGRMVIPVKAEHKNRVHGFIHSASSSGATVFVEPTETLELNNEIRSLHFQEQREIERILKELTQQVGEARNALGANLGILARVDLLQAKARYSIEVLGIAPHVSAGGAIRLIGARHPVLIMTHGLNGTVPLNLEIGDEYTALVISGPNAGGKSVAMKTVGILTLMAQAGLHIPAGDGTEVRVFTKFFVDIGDEQSIENDLSTFSSHLVNLKRIVSEADDRSLVLIDEIGSGTDPGEGGAIAASVLEHLTLRRAVTIATTHQGALKVFAHETPGVENGAMEFDQATLTPTYTFKSGIPGSSYALEMAQRLGFDPQLMARSRDRLGHQQAKLEALIAELEASAQRYRKQLETVETEKSHLHDLVQQYEARISTLSTEVKELKRKAIEEADKIVERANATIERSIREIREKKAEREVIRDVRKEVQELKEDLAVQRAQVAPAPARRSEKPLTVGTAVRLSGGQDVGEIVSVAPDAKTAVVVFGMVRMRVATSELEQAERRPQERASFVQSEKPETVETELDVRGMTGDEAIPLVDKFLDTAVLAGLHRVDIIHGKGTGALRKKITEFLGRHPRVKSYRIAEWNEGGTGATVVELGEGAS